jgi:hypothetical protein
MTVIASHGFDHSAATLDIRQMLTVNLFVRQLFTSVYASSDHSEHN